MKQLTLSNLFNSLLIFAIVFSLSSCTEDLSVEEEFGQDVNATLIYQQITKAEDFEAVKLKFNTLSDLEKVDLWLYHIDQLTAYGKFNPTQLNFLEDTKQFIQNEINTQGAETKNNADKIDAYFAETSEDIFSQDELIQMFTLSHFAERPVIDAENADQRQLAPWCNCRWNSECQPATSGCSGNFSCHQYTGCGLLGWQACTGRCVNIVVIEIEVG